MPDSWSTGAKHARRIGGEKYRSQKKHARKVKFMRYAYPVRMYLWMRRHKRLAVVGLIFGLLAYGYLYGMLVTK